jgi:hypothetical protein
MQVSRTVGVENRFMSGPVDVWSIALPLPGDLAVRLSTAERVVAERDRLHRENKELRQVLEATVELNRMNDRHIEAEAKVKALVAELGSWTQANQEIAALKAGIVAYRVGGGWPATWEKAHGSLVSPTAQETTG